MVRKVMLGMYVTVLALAVPGAVIAQPAAHPPAPGSATTVEATEDPSGSPVFKPNTSTIKVGDTITFKNTGKQPHTATSDDGTTFDSSNLSPGQSFTTKPITTAGTLTYKCSYHVLQGMTGTITVQGTGGAAPTTTASAAPSASASVTASASASPDTGISPSPTPTAPPSQKYFPKIAGAILGLLILGVALGYLKTARKLADKG